MSFTNRMTGGNTSSFFHTTDAKPVVAPEDKFIKSDPTYMEWDQYESGFYYHDQNHSGCVFVTQAMVDKYNLKEEPIEEWYAERIEDEEDEDELKYLQEMKDKFAQYIYIHHYNGFSEMHPDEVPDYDCISHETPHGDCHSEELVAWMNGFPVELFSEPDEHVHISGWADG